MEEIKKQILKYLAEKREIDLNIKKKVIKKTRGQYTISEIAQGINQKEKIVKKYITILLKEELVESKEYYEDTITIGSGIHKRTSMGMEPQSVTRYFLKKTGI